MRGTQKYTDDELKRYLNEWVQEHGEEPSQGEWNAQDDLREVSEHPDHEALTQATL